MTSYFTARAAPMTEQARKIYELRTKLRDQPNAKEISAILYEIAHVIGDAGVDMSMWCADVAGWFEGRWL